MYLLPFDTFQCLDAFEKLTGFITPRLTAVTPLLRRGRKHSLQWGWQWGFEKLRYMQEFFA